MKPLAIRRNLIWFGSLVLVFALSTPTCRAQSDGYVNNSNLRGVVPFGSYQFGQIDNINLGTGTLNLNIPVAKRKGRGLLDVKLSFTYSSKVWVFSCVKDVQGLTHCSWFLTDDPTKNVMFVYSPGGVLGWDAEEYDCTDRLGNEYVQINTSNYIYREANGAAYRFPNSSDTSSPPNHSCASGRTISVGVSDMEAMELDTPTPSTFTIHFKDGTSKSSQGPSMVDTNGNQISSTGDTLKRTVTYGPQSWIFSDSNGSAQTYTLSQPISPIPTPAFPTTTCGGADISQHGLPGLSTAPSTLTLPNGLQYTFTYDANFGEITRVNLPTGGYIRYDYVTLPQFDRVPPGITACLYIDSRRVAHRYLSPDGVAAHEQTWTYAYAGGYQTTVTDPLGFVTVHTFSSDGIHETQTQFYDQFNHLLRTVTNTWAADAFPVQTNQKGNGVSESANWRLTAVTTTLADTNQVSQTATTYDSYTFSYVGTTYTTSRLNPLETREYDYGAGAAGALLRRTTFAYQHVSNSNYLNKHILDRVTFKIIYDSTNNTCQGQSRPCAQTTFGYDTTTIAQTSGVVQHDYVNFPSTMTIRGNVTSIQNWRNTDGAWLTTTKYYDDLGNLKQTQDPLLHNTFFDYTDSFSATGNVCIPTGGTGQAFATKITNHLNQFAKYSYYSCSSWLATAIDLNNQTTTFTYDLLDRQLQTNVPDGGQQTNCFSDTNGSSCYSSSTPLYVTTTTKIASSPLLNLVSTGYVDGLGRLRKTILNSDPNGATYTRTDYDVFGRNSTVWNPTRCDPDVNPTSCTGESTFGTTQFQFDAFGRSTKVIPPDGTISSDNLTTSYVGNCTTVTDQAGKIRKTCSDALGRLTQVFEDPSGLNYETDYSYDVLDNLLTVNQKGGSASSANWRTRTFVYDSLSRLTSSTNPEANIQPVSPFAIVPTTYVYDPNGNLSTKSAPAPNQTGTARVVTTYTYDALNRLTQKSFSDSTPTVKYGYDAIAPAGCTLPSLTIGNGIGKRTGMCDAAGAEAWSYDITAGTGWKITDARTTNSVTKSTIVQNNLAGLAATLTYPSGRIITYSYSAAARPVSAIDSTGPINYVTATAYVPTGAPSSLTNGASLVSTLYYNNRLQPCRISVKNSGTAPATCTDAATGNVLDFTYNFSVGTADNGNVTAISNNRDPLRSQSFTYDALNRLATAQTSATFATGPTKCWGEQFTYDPWANFLSITSSGSPYTGCTQEGLSTTATTKNQISGFCYDTAGNLLAQSAPPCPSPTYTYNAEDQMTLTAGVTYTYDGDGRRVQKSSGKLYWYGLGSDPLDETDLAGNTNNTSFNEYIFFGGKRIARRDSTNAVNYYFADHLGTARIVASTTGTVLDDSDFYPFGGERVYLNSSPQNYKFTGKERDSESGLDYFGARFDASSFGRFMSPDPISGTVLHILNPQRWNMYVYAVNNPLSYVDPDGRDAIAVKFGNLAHNFGHAGVVSVHQDGKGTFADFGPQHAGQAHDAGKYNFIDYKTQIKYGPDGKPTQESLSALANELADAEDQPHDSVSVAYFKTSDAETAALDAYIKAAKDQQAKGKTPSYWVGARDCIAFCMNGMQKAGVGPGYSPLTIPNLQYINYWLSANQVATGTKNPQEKVTSKVCHYDQSGNIVCP